MFRTTTDFAALIGTYADQSEPKEPEETEETEGTDEGTEGEEQESEEDLSIIIPENLGELSADDLDALHTRAIEGFDTLYGEGKGLSEDDLSTLSTLTEGIEALSGEIENRKQHEAERAEKAAALAAKVHTNSSKTDENGEKDEDEEPETDEDGNEVPEPPTDEDSAKTVTAASTRREVRLPASRLRAGRSAMAPAATQSDGKPTSMKDVMRASGDGTGFAQGTGIDWSGVGSIVDRRLQGFNLSQYQSAASRGRHLRQQFSVATIEKPISDDLKITSSDPAHVEDVLNRATSEKHLPGNSLVAAGGWCAPSETVYDLLEVESRDGLYDLPSIGISRGGINRTLGPDFADIFAEDIGFHYTEAEDIAGDYDGEGGGSKPCYRIECTDFEEFRLEVDGICITAGLLMQRGYPELIARTTRGVLVAHDHKLAGRRINEVVAGSDAVTMPTTETGSAAPLLSSIEKQVEHMRYVRRLARTTTMEAVFPFWVHGAIRADLALRQGVDLLSVSNEQINAWFGERGIRPQFVYNWQDLTGDASGFTAWPTEVQFLLYPAGTWVAAGENIISIDTLYDSVLLGQNDYTALFTEESWLVLKMGFDSRVVTVPLCHNGATNAGIQIGCDGAVAGE